MKRYIFLSIILLALIPVSVVFYYKLDPAFLAKLSFYVDLANPYMRIVKIDEGLRKEEVAEVMGKKLDWNEKDKEAFVNAHLALNNENPEGRYFPKTYLIYKDETPEVVSTTMFDEFSKQVDAVKKTKLKTINESTALKVASIIQREAAGKGDMNLISGIIWNRIWSGMKLQVDATLQYAKGNIDGGFGGWWEEVKSEDKKIDSPYNTYLHIGLPPGAISNPGIDAIAAAYNPQKTDCVFYLHDRNRNIHCSKTYEEHKRNIEIYLK